VSFTATVFQNEYLPAGSGEVHAIVTVDAGDAAVAAVAPSERSIVLIVDTSGSMSSPMSKIHAARQAVAAAVDELPDGVNFAIVSGFHEATLMYPRSGRDLVAASETTRADAREVASNLDPSGGTAISTWLQLARELFDGHAGIKLAYLLTDGKNESESADRLTEELARCAGQFQCDARGVGDQWVVDELRRITSTLLGQVDIIKEPDLMDDDFRDFMARALGKTIGDVRLQVWAPQGANIRYVKQVAPSIEDLTALAEPADTLTNTYPTGAWAPGESRDYHVCIDVPPGEVGDERLAARIMLALDGEVTQTSLVKSIFTGDHALTTRIDPQVAHYTGQAELATAIREGLAARRDGDEAEATVKLGRAVQLAHESGNESTVRLLAKVVEVEDPAAGTVRLKKKVETIDEMELDTRSTRTVRVTPKGGA